MPALPWGLTVYGFRAKTLEEIRSEMETRAIDELRDADGRALLNVKVGPVHQIIGICSSQARELWEALEALHAAADPDRAIGAAQDALCALTGTTRQAPTKSRLTATLTLTNGTTVPAGSIASVVGAPDRRFVTLEDVTATADDDYDVECEAETAGPVAANAGTLTVIETPVAGWTAVTNALDAVQGADVEEDSELRARREEELSAQGTSPRDAIRADLLRMLAAADITNGSVTVLMNVTDVVDGDGLPPHSVEALVHDGTDDGSGIDDDAIAQVLWDTVAAGIQTYGTSTGTAVDSLGVEHTVSFSRPTLKTVYVSVSVNVATSRGWDASAGSTSIKEAIVALGESVHGVGDDVTRFRLLSAVFDVEGVIDVTAFTLGFTATPVGTVNLTIAARELAVFDTSRVVVTPTVVTPP